MNKKQWIALLAGTLICVGISIISSPSLGPRAVSQQQGPDGSVVYVQTVRVTWGIFAGTLATILITVTCVYLLRTDPKKE